MPLANGGDITQVGDAAQGRAFDGTQGTILTFKGLNGLKNATLSWDDSPSTFGGGSRSILKLLAVGGGSAQVIAGDMSGETQGYFDIFAAVGASALGCSGGLGVLVCETKSSAVGTGGLLLTGFNDGASPINGEALFTHYAFGYDGFSAIALKLVSQVTASEDWSFTDANGTDHILYATEIGTGSDYRMLSMHTDTRGIIINEDQRNYPFQIYGVGGPYVYGDSTNQTFYINSLEVDRLNKYQGVLSYNGAFGAVMGGADSSNLLAAISTTTLMTTPAGIGATLYRVSLYAKVTRAGSVSSTLGGANGFQVIYTNGDDSVVVTTPAVPNAGGATLTANTTQTFYSGNVLIYAASNTNIQFKFDYTSSGTGATLGMKYDAKVRVEAL